MCSTFLDQLLATWKWRSGSNSWLVMMVNRTGKMTGLKPAENTMELDLNYLKLEDRMRLSLRGQANWLVTRSLLLKLLPAWLEKLQSIDLPSVGIPLGPRDLGQEHALSLEFDAPKSTNFQPIQAPADMLLIEIKLTVDALGAKLHLIGQGRTSQLVLTRKESHNFLEMLAQKARVVGWLDTAQLPQWLGPKP